jgi:hypothetical protein
VQNLYVVENSGYFLHLLKVTSRFAHWARFLFLPYVGYSHFPLRDSRILLFTILLFFTCLLNPVHASVDSPIKLTSDSEVATAGFFQLRWQSNSPGPWQLQESENSDLKDYKVIYSGPDLARVISGKSNGIYYYQVVAIKNPVSEKSNIIKVTVAHHPLTNAFIFFIVGALIFLAILFSILKGNRTNNQS